MPMTRIDNKYGDAVVIKQGFFKRTTYHIYVEFEGCRRTVVEGNTASVARLAKRLQACTDVSQALKYINAIEGL